MLSYMGTHAQAVGAGRDYAGLLGRADRLVGMAMIPVIQYFIDEIMGINWMTLMCYVFAIVCTLSAAYRFGRIWAELD